MAFNSCPKILFPGFLNICQFHSPQPCKSADYFIKVSFQIVVDMRQGESNIFQASTWKAFFYYLKYICYEKSDRFRLKGGNWCGSMHPPPPPVGHSLIWPIGVCAAEQVMVFMVLSLKQGI